MERKCIDIRWLPNSHQFADFLTKPVQASVRSPAFLRTGALSLFLAEQQEREEHTTTCTTATRKGEKGSPAGQVDGCIHPGTSGCIHLSDPRRWLHAQATYFNAMSVFVVFLYFVCSHCSIVDVCTIWLRTLGTECFGAFARAFSYPFCTSFV